MLRVYPLGNFCAKILMEQRHF